MICKYFLPFSGLSFYFFCILRHAKVLKFDCLSICSFATYAPLFCLYCFFCVLNGYCLVCQFNPLLFLVPYVLGYFLSGCLEDYNGHFCLKYSSSD